MRRRVGTSLYAGLLFTVLGMIAWTSGQPFIFPSLGPTAFVLAFDRRSERTQAYRVVGSHAIGGVAGLLAWAVIATGVPITTSPEPFSVEGLRLAASATVSIVLTSWAMIATDAIHPPACATTLIVSLGLLSTPLQVAIIVVSVAILVTFWGARGLQTPRRRHPPALPRGGLIVCHLTCSRSLYRYAVHTPPTDNFPNLPENTSKRPICDALTNRREF